MDGTRVILSPILFINYVCGIRIIEFPAGKPRPWCSFLYILLLWSIYCFLYLCTLMHYISDLNNDDSDSDNTYLFALCFWLNNLTILLSIVFGIYHDKKYRACLRQLDIVDDTLKKIGMITDYQKLYTKTLLVVFGWIAYGVCAISACALWHKVYYGAFQSYYISFIFGYSSLINMLDDLLIVSILRYIELKFEQINEYLRKLDEYNGHAIQQTWAHSTLLPCQSGYAKSKISSEHATWVTIHLHLELCKISRQLNSVFGLQMTIKMGAYFALLAAGFRQIFNLLFITKYNYNQKKTLLIILVITFLTKNTCRLFIINYMCEKVSVKANATKDLIIKIPYSTPDVVVYENISQFLLHISLTPLKFYGLGLFKFGLKFFYGFSSSISTIIVILIQSYTEK